MALANSHPDIDAVMDILGVCVLADRLERDVELIEFVDGVQRLARNIAPERIVSRGELLEWFSANKERLCAIHDDDAAKRELLSRVTDIKLRHDTLVAIFSICVCDYHMADEESAFLALAIDEWKPGAPLTAEALEAIA